VLPRGIDLEVAVWVDDFESPTGHERGMPFCGNPKPASPPRLHEPLAHPPLVLHEEQFADIGEGKPRQPPRRPGLREFA
jgi:hypothetical protein